MAEKYTTTGGYVYTLDNPIRMIDLDGRKWDESSVTQKNGNVTINLTLTVAILNSSNKKFDLKKTRKCFVQPITKFLWNFICRRYELRELC